MIKVKVGHKYFVEKSWMNPHAIEVRGSPGANVEDEIVTIAQLD